MIALGVVLAIMAVASLGFGLLLIVNPAKGFLMGRRWQFDGPLPQPSGCALAMTRASGVVGVVSGLIFGLWAAAIFFGSN
jgi:hypothetical protein